MIECRNLAFTYPHGDQPVLKAFSKNFAEGQCYLVSGPHGSGKSTLLRLLASQKFHYIEGKLQGDVLHFIDQNDLVYVSSDDHTHFVYNTVYDEYYYTLRSLGFPKYAIERHIPDMLRRFRIAAWMHKSTEELSKGQKQFLKLVIALSTKPFRCILLDEPFLHVDPHHRDILLEYITKLHNKYNCMIVVADHHATTWNRHLPMQSIELSPHTSYMPWLDVSFPSLSDELSHRVEILNTPGSNAFPKELLVQGRRCLVIQGPNASGKTTLCKYMMGMFEHKPSFPFSKHMLLDEPRMMFLTNALFQEWSDVSIEVQHSYPERHPLHLSLGQAKIEMLQLLMAQLPDVLVLDDFFEGLDRMYLGYAHEMIQRWVQSGRAVVMTTSQPWNAKEYDEVIAL